MAVTLFPKLALDADTFASAVLPEIAIPVAFAVIPNEPVGRSKLQAAAFAALGARKGLVKTGFADAMNADRAAYAAQVNRYATPALQRMSPEFATAAEADRVAHASILGRYVSPALERTEGLLGGAGGLAAGAAEFLGPLAMAEGVTRAVDSIPTDPCTA